MKWFKNRHERNLFEVFHFPINFNDNLAFFAKSHHRSIFIFVPGKIVSNLCKVYTEICNNVKIYDKECWQIALN